VEAANSFLGITPLVELDEREPTWLTGVAVRRQIKRREWTNGGEVRPQLRLGHVIGKVANKKTHSHQVLLQCRWCIDTTNARRVAV
jgi:hypothetical protein